MNATSELENALAEILPRLVEIRHDLHQHPELGFEEHRTQGLVREWLVEHGYTPRDCAGTGLIADLSPSFDGRTIALRADLDALPMPEHTDLPYRSVHEGRAHKCGHDGHTTIMLGTAAALAAMRDRIDGNVRILFQPAEEGVRGGGARVMVAEGALDGVDEVYGLHNWPNFPKGEVRVIGGPTMAQVYTLHIELRGKGGHGSQPERCRDPIAAGAQLVTALNTITSRNVGHRGGGVLSICCFQSGTTHNVVPRTATLIGTVRCFDPEIGERIIERVREVVAGTAAAMSVEAQLDVERGYPVLVNHDDCAEVVEQVATDVVGADRVSSRDLPIAASEDFSYMAEAVPGAYFFLGAGLAGEATPSCHHPDFDFDDDLIATGVRMFSGIAMRRANPV